MNSHSARILGASLAFSTIVVAAGVVTAGTGGQSPTEKDTIGVFDSTTKTFFLRNFNSKGTAGITVHYGPANSVPLIGDWDGTVSNTDTIGVYSPSLGRFLLNNANTAALSRFPAIQLSYPSDWRF